MKTLFTNQEKSLQSEVEIFTNLNVFEWDFEERALKQNLQNLKNLNN